MISISILVAVPVAFYTALLLLWRSARAYHYRTCSGIPDIDLLVSDRSGDQKRPKIKGQVVICGGSLGGLLCARVCSDYFEKVLIVEPEAWLTSDDGKIIHAWEQKNTRSRVLQYYGLNALQGLNVKILSALFPGFEEECRKSGIKVGLVEALTLGGTLLNLPGTCEQDLRNRKTIFTSRAGLESLLRRLVLSSAYPNIEQVSGTVTGIIPDANDPSTLSGVTVRTTEGNQNIQGSLVIDCTGLTKAGIKWLERARYGYADVYPTGRLPLKDIRIDFDQKLFYTTQTYTLTDSLFDRLPVPGGMSDAGQLMLYLEDKPVKGRRMLVVMKPDGKRLQVYASESNDDRYSLKTLDEMIAFKDALPPFRDPFPEWFHRTLEMLKEVEDTAVVSSGRVPPTAYLRYHMATNLPSNFISVGDSIMSLGPVYAQGITKTALGAIALNNILRTQKSSTLSADFAERYFEEHVNKNDIFWQGTKLLDYGISTTVPMPGTKLSEGAWVRAYLRRVQILAIDYEDASRAVLSGVMSLGSPLDVFHPNMALKVLWDVIKRPYI